MGKQLRDAFKKAGWEPKPATATPGQTDVVPRKTLTLKDGGSKGRLAQRIEEHRRSQRGNERDRSKRASERDRAQRNRERREARTAAEQHAFELANSRIADAYGPGKRSASPEAVAPPALGHATVTKSGLFEPHPLFGAAAEATVSRCRPRHGGISKQLAGTPSDESDLVLGLDFGTSCTKAVIRDQTAGRAYSVRFTNAFGREFLLSSRLFRSGSAYSLDGGEISFRDLKLRLLNANVASPVGEFNDACAFLALAIRHCRGWLLDEFASRYRDHRLNWQVNLGLPARSYEAREKVRLFRRLAWAAASCAASSSPLIDEDLVDQFRVRSRELFNEGGKVPAFAAEFQPEDVDVVPEIAAQIAGFVESAKWDWKHRPMMMMVDVGAGTVDSAFFSVGRERSGQLRFAFFADEVLQNGVMNLHRERVAWLGKCFVNSAVVDDPVTKYLDAIAAPTDRTAAIPESEADYIRGYRISIPEGGLGIDDDFYRHRYSPQVFACIRQARLEKGVPDSQLSQLPFFMCGGGSRMNLYSRISGAITRAAINVTADSQSMGRPDDLLAEGLDPKDYDRQSVAYGLSRRGPDGGPLGKYVRSVEIPKVLPRTKLDYEVKFVDKSMM